MNDSVVRPRPAKGILVYEVLDELVAYCPESSQAISLNLSARAIWELCDGTRTIDDICAELSEPARLPEQSLKPDVEAAVDRLREVGLLTFDDR